MKKGWVLGWCGGGVGGAIWRAVWGYYVGAASGFRGKRYVIGGT